jgi:hypothetical protein
MQSSNVKTQLENALKRAKISAPSEAEAKSVAPALRGISVHPEASQDFRATAGRLANELEAPPFIADAGARERVLREAQGLLASA